MTIRYDKGASDVIEVASMSKLITSLVLRDWVLDVNLDDTVTVTSYDTTAGGSSADLLVNDVLSYRDLMYGLFIASGNDAARCISRHVGSLIIAGGGPGSSLDPATRFLQAMEDKCAGRGYVGYSINGPAGFPEQNYMRLIDVADAIMQCANDAFLLTALGAPSRTITITGANARTYGLTRSFNPAAPIPFPEWIGAKTGNTTGAGVCVAFLWEAPDETLRVTVTAGAATGEARYADVRALLDYEIGRMS